MTICFQIPRLLQPYCQGHAELGVEAATVRAALEQVRQRHPQLYPNICDETGAVRRHLNLFVNQDLLSVPGGLDTKLETGDVVAVFPAVSGG